MAGSGRGVVISLISGKGGVGKTALTASFGKVLSELGFRVLLIDSDLFTHGLTFLLGGTFRDQEASHSGLIEILTQGVKATPIEIGPRLFLIASTTSPRRATSLVVQQKLPQVMEIFAGFLSAMKNSGDWDYILVDSQAGPEAMTYENVRDSDKVVIVMEADPVSGYAARNLETEMGRELPTSRYYLVNKFFLFQKDAAKAIRDAFRIIAFLPPIPFDLDVVIAFMNRTIPINIDGGGAFLEALLDCTKDLVPETSPKIEQLRRTLRELGVKTTVQKIDELRKELDYLDVQRRKLRTSIDTLGSSSTFLATFRAGIPILLTVLAVVAFSTGSIFNVFTEITILAIAAALLGVYRFVREREETLRQSRSVSQQELERIEGRATELYDEISRNRALVEGEEIRRNRLGETNITR